MIYNFVKKINWLADPRRRQRRQRKSADLD